MTAAEPAATRRAIRYWIGFGVVVALLGAAPLVLPRKSACYRCLFKAPPPPEEILNCQASGILGAVAGTIGAIQATEAVKYLAGFEDGLLTDRLLVYDAKNLRFREVEVRRDPHHASASGQSGARTSANGRRTFAPCLHHARARTVSPSVGGGSVFGVGKKTSADSARSIAGCFHRVREQDQRLRYLQRSQHPPRNSDWLCHVEREVLLPGLWPNLDSSSSRRRTAARSRPTYLVKA